MVGRNTSERLDDVRGEVGRKILSLHSIPLLGNFGRVASLKVEEESLTVTEVMFANHLATEEDDHLAEISDPKAIAHMVFGEILHTFRDGRPL